MRQEVKLMNETLDKKKNLNNKEQIDKLTKDLYVRRRSVFSKINTSPSVFSQRKNNRHAFFLKQKNNRHAFF